MTEAKMRQIVVFALKSLGAMSVENLARPGTPDVNYIEGWIELKILPKWPARKKTPVVVSCFTPQQRVWLYRRCLLGGKATFLLRIGKEWLLFDGDLAAKKIGTLDQKAMRQNAILVSSDSDIGKELLAALR